MSDSNVQKLADLQQVGGSESPPLEDPDAVPSEIKALGTKADTEQVRALTHRLVLSLRESSELETEATRETYLRTLANTVKAPARIFDAALRDVRPRSGASDSVQGRALTFDDPTPWPDPVDGAPLIRNLVEILERFVVLDSEYSTTLALWILHTYVFDTHWITPRLAITSPEKRCGKTLVLTLLRQLVNRPLMTANATPAAIFRCIESVRPTLLIDEADTFLQGRDELRGVLNSGHQKDGCVLRTAGDDHEPRAFSTFAPCAIALIGLLPDTLADRSVTLRMARKRPEDMVERFRLDQVEDFEPLRQKAHRWTLDVADLLKRSDPPVPPGLNDRAADNWRPLLALADAAGDPWPEIARQAAIQSYSGAESEDPSTGVQLLADVLDIFRDQEVEQLFTREILYGLTNMEDRPWPEWKAGQPLSARQLAKLLQPFGIRPRQLRAEDKTAKGYRLTDFTDAASRYVPTHTARPLSLPETSETTP